MLGAIIGDIVGSRFQFLDYKSKKFTFFEEHCVPTDDTIMTLAVAKALLLGIMAGLFIAIGGMAFEMATAMLGGSTVGKFIGACLFPAGLTLVLTAGSELFTGNCLLIIPLMQKEVKFAAVVKSWIIDALSRGRFSLCSERRVGLLYLEAFALGNNYLFLGKSNGKYSVLVFGADAVLVYSFKAEGALKGAIAPLAADVAVGLVLRIGLLFRFKGQLAVLDLGGYIVAGEARKLCLEKIAISLIQNVGLKGGSLMPEKAFLNAEWLEEWVEE